MTDLNREFYEQLTSELEIARSLHQLLLTERQLLDPPDLKPLQTIQTEKKQQLEALRKTAEQRCKWLSLHDIPLDKHCINHPLLAGQTPEDNERLLELWQELAAQFEENRRLTDVLGNIVLRARNRTQNLLKILHGQKNVPNLYNKSGHARAAQTGTGFAKA